MIAPDTVWSVVSDCWSSTAIATLSDYICIPALSPAFDPDWEHTGHLADAVALLRDWCERRPIAGMTVSVATLPSRTPLLLIEVAPTRVDSANSPSTVLLYGHLDKQPEMFGWREGLGPWTPVLEGDRLYGRGGGDDGYSVFAALSAVEAVQRSGGVHSRLLVLIEASEESGSVDLPAHLEALGDRLGNISLVVCLDSGCDDYERLWNTTSLRGVVRIDLTVEVLAEGIHSGVASGIVPSSMRLMRQLLDRIEDVETGEVLVPEMHVPIPAHRITETATQARMRDAAHTWFPFAGATEPMGDDPTELLLNSTWRPTLSYIAAGGLPAIGAGGNVLRPSTTLSLSFRTPPGVDPDGAAAAAIAILTANPPNNATVHAALHDGAWGWDAPKVAPWLDEALTAASVRCFGNPPAAFGEGGSIPFMAMLGLRFPDAQFVVTGALGPDANAHGPNEYVHLPTAQRVAASIALVLDAEARRSPTHVH